MSVLEHTKHNNNIILINNGRRVRRARRVCYVAMLIERLTRRLSPTINTNTFDKWYHSTPNHGIKDLPTLSTLWITALHEEMGFRTMPENPALNRHPS
jgi:hypothetical protein